MTDSEIRQLEMLIRVRVYGTERKDAFPKDSRGGELFTLIEEIITEVEGHAATQASSKRAAKLPFDAPRKRGVTAVRELDAMVRNVFRKAPPAWAEWTGASHVARPPRQRPTAPAQTPPPTPTTPSA